MEQKDFKTLFGKIVDVQTAKAFEGAVVNSCNVDTLNRALTVEIATAGFVEQGALTAFENSVKAALKLNDIYVRIEELGDFARQTFNNEKEDEQVSKQADLEEDLPLSDGQAFETEDLPEIKTPEDISADDTDLDKILDGVKAQIGIAGGFLIGAVLTLEGKNAVVSLKNGGLESIKSSNFEKLLKRRLKETLGADYEVTYGGKTDFEIIDTPQTTTQKPAKKTAQKEEKTALNYDPAVPPKDGLPVYLQSAKRFFGSNVKKSIIRIKDVEFPTDEYSSVRVNVIGEIFNSSTEIKNVRGGKMVVCNFCVSDGTNALNVAIKQFFAGHMGDAGRDSRVFAKRLAPIIDGVWVLLNGDIAYDSFHRGFVLQVKSAATVDKYEPSDNYDGAKRVELHCHTNMSAKDAVSSAGDIIKRAYAWGHKSIAITDHGVVQAYPDIAAAVSNIKESGGDFKAIYGVESYFIDDIRHDLKDLTGKEISKLRNHQIILVKNLTGLKNLYKIVSDAHLNHFHSRPVTMRSTLDKYREGLIIGSACEQGELFRAIVDQKSDEELLEIASYYDYLEIQPLGNNRFMIKKSQEPDAYDRHGNLIFNRFRHVTSEEVLMQFNRKVVEIADKLNKPVVATGDVHFLSKEDGILRQIVLAGQGYDDIEDQAPLYLKTTEEMLSDFSYFGERAKEFVIDNPGKIADMVSDDVIPVPKGNYPPVIEGSDDMLRSICNDTAHRIYGEKLPKIVESRMNRELDSIIVNGYSIMYVSAQKLVDFSEQNGYLVGSRGSVGSSFVATLAGISEVNPLPPHYVCPKCKKSEFITDNSVGSGFDLPPKNCPDCGTPYNRDGHNIPFETFLGFDGTKVPDIDLNFADEVQNKVQEYTKTLFGAENVFKAGTISTIAEKTAYGFVRAYIEKTGKTLNSAEIDRLAKKLESAQVKQTTGQHPAGMIIVPSDKEIYDFCPIQHPADDVTSDVITTHFDFNSIHDTILKLDELGHVVPTTYKYLEEYSGVPVSQVPMTDKEVYTLFTSPKALGVASEEIFSKTGTLCLPEFGTRNTRDMLVDCKPTCFADLLQISGLSHGENVYHGNAKELIDNGTCTISEVIGTRDNIMVYLISKGLDSATAFKITETVRKGLYAKEKISQQDWNKMEDLMRKAGVPEWYINSCKKIKYMFPKAHAAAYVIGAIRLAWYKVYKPLEFYCAYFTARPDDVDVPTILKGVKAIRAKIESITAKGKEAEKKELDIKDNLLIFNEMLTRGYQVLPIDIKHSHAKRFLPENGKMRLPFYSINGIGENAANAIYETAQKNEYLSVEDFRMLSGVSKTVIAKLEELGAFGDLEKSNQLSLF